MELRLRLWHASPVRTGGACCIWPLAKLAPALLLLATVLTSVLAGGCRRAEPAGPIVLRLSGAAMGTTWSAIAVPGERALPDGPELQARIAAVLESVEDPLSTWRPKSTISRFNGLAPGESIEVGADFLRCLEVSEDVHARSGGAFDPTVGPLVRAYGFESGELDVELPEDAELEALRAQVGWRRWVTGPAAPGSPLIQLDPPVLLDLSAVAKGRGVDAVHEALADLELAGLFFELGGEVRVFGSSPRGDLWRVGVELPADDPSAPRQLAVPIEVSSCAVATSGFGRNQRRIDGEWVAHAFDPRSGRPARRQVGSATVLAESADLADALATALCVLTPDEALALIEDDGRAEAVLLLPEEGGGWTPRWTSGLIRTEAGPLRLTGD